MVDSEAGTLKEWDIELGKLIILQQAVKQPICCPRGRHTSFFKFSLYKCEPEKCPRPCILSMHHKNVQGHSGSMQILSPNSESLERNPGPLDHILRTTSFLLEKSCCPFLTKLFAYHLLKNKNLKNHALRIPQHFLRNSSLCMEVILLAHQSFSHLLDK